MALPIRKPCVIMGTPRNSGDVQTGEVMTTRGGGQVYTLYSGTAAGNDILVLGGGGRLNTIVQHLPGSGLPCTIYDGAVATSGGPFAASGHKVVGVVPGNPNVGLLNASPTPIVVDMPFQSGLILATKSGQNGFSISYTPEVIPAIQP